MLRTRRTSIATLVIVLGAFALAGGCQKPQPAATPTSTTARQHQPLTTTPSVWAFDGVAPLGQVPPGWRIAETNPTRNLASWAVARDPSAPSGDRVFTLTQTDNYDGTYNLAIATGACYRDLDLQVHVKALAGNEDQGGGPIWRCQDENNYYICRVNPLEENFRVYVVKDGKRRQLASATVPLERLGWYELSVRHVGDQITCSLDGEPLLGATDSTITAPGQVGLWTKADAVTSFDTLKVSPAE